MSRKGRQLSSGISTVNLRAVLTLLAVVTISSGVVIFSPGYKHVVNLSFNMHRIVE